jgi:hypothetical protein
VNTDRFKLAYGESRNGANQFFRHPMARKFMYSDGVQECAETGCYWLLDILGTELPAAFAKARENFCVVTVTVIGNKAKIVGKFHDDDRAPYTRDIAYTDMPEGEWQFFVANEGPEFGLRCFLPSEY